MRSLKKMAAAVMAVATLATSMVPLSADALTFAENSKFAYDLDVEGTSDDMVKVTFYTTYNPGVSGLSIALKYDQNKLEFVKNLRDVDYDFATTKVINDASEKGMIIAASASNTGHDYTGQIYYSYYFKIKDTSKKQNYDFSSCVIGYNSENENINFDKQNSQGVYPDENIENVVKKGVYTRRIGDVIPSTLVDMKDVTELYGIISFLNSCTTPQAPYIEFLNSMLTADYSYTMNDGKTGTYRDRLKNSLYVDDVPFAEVADCDQNGIIEKNDGDLLITYYAQVAAGQNPESLINNELSKVVYADITM